MKREKWTFPQSMEESLIIQERQTRFKASFLPKSMYCNFSLHFLGSSMSPNNAGFLKFTLSRENRKQGVIDRKKRVGSGGFHSSPWPLHRRHASSGIPAVGRDRCSLMGVLSPIKKALCQSHYTDVFIIPP